jgi:hypothetical protein
MGQSYINPINWNRIEIWTISMGQRIKSSFSLRKVCEIIILIIVIMVMKVIVIKSTRRM